MPPLPRLALWEQTAPSLHQAAEILGIIRRLVREPVPSYQHLALRIERAGLSTDTLPSGGHIRLDFGQAALVSADAAGMERALPLAGHSQESLAGALLREADAQGAALVRPSDGADYIQALLAALEAKGRALKPAGDGPILRTTPLTVDGATSAAYGEALYRAFTAIARFRARLAGPQSPIVVWPEHFDLSTLWFASSDTSYSAPQMNIGFAPFDSVHTRPYLYAYAYPMPEGFAELPLPAPARWNTTPWKGMVLAYDDLLQASDPEALIEALCETAYTLLAPTLA